jgi:hypothetical protein
MIYHNRGETINFANTFYDQNGFLTTVGSATVTLVYPSSTPPGNLLSHDPGQLKGVVTIPMVVDPATGIWSATWDSSVSDPGSVFWSIKSTVGNIIVEDGVFVLRGNLANMEVP